MMERKPVKMRAWHPASTPLVLDAFAILEKWEVAADLDDLIETVRRMSPAEKEEVIDRINRDRDIVRACFKAGFINDDAYPGPPSRRPFSRQR
jgi:hypothetical protein